MEAWNGDEILNTAYIYFDLNPPIVTNTVSTVIENLDVSEVARDGFAFYPNPADDRITISNPHSSQMRVSIVDLQGKVLGFLDSVPNYYEMDVSHLSAGIYLIRVETDGKHGVKKLVIN